MKIKNKSFFGLLTAVSVSIILHACAGMGSIRGQNVRIYHQSIDKMVDITEMAIHNRGYSIISIEQRNESSRRTKVSFAKRSTVGRQMTMAMQAYVFLAISDTADAVEVRIVNPDYSYGTPTDQRLDYAKLLFNEIDELLK